MKYLAQSDLWRLDRMARGLSRNGKSRVLAQFRQVFPLTLFPDELIIEELRIVWVQKNGPWTNNVISIMATDIACVNASTGPFFGHVHIQSLTGGPEILIDNLSRSDAFKIRSLVESIALSAREGLKINYQNIETEKENLLRASRLKLA